METEARRRAVEGEFEWIYDKNGNPIYRPDSQEPDYRYVKSDRLLMFLLQGHQHGRKYAQKHDVQHSADDPSKKVLDELTSAIQGLGEEAVRQAQSESSRSVGGSDHGDAGTQGDGSERPVSDDDPGESGE